MKSNESENSFDGLSIDAFLKFTFHFIAMKCAWYQFVWILVLAWVTSCSPKGDSTFVEVRDSTYLEGKQRIREGDYEGALESFLEVVQTQAYSPESHLEAGVILLQQLEDPISAIYHFNQYLQQKPESREAPLVAELILSARKEFAASLPANPFKNAVSRMELMETISALKNQIAELNAELQRLEARNAELESRLVGAKDTIDGIFDSRRVAADGTEGEVTVEVQELNLSETELASLNSITSHQSDQSQIPDRYQVKAGDSLYAISMKIYGDANHIQAIFQANRNILKSANDLRPGQILVLPK